mmetsp:Transcript_26818/g.80792  ORF Transcript_26818/g.80792 Transcript_26818/m.80792 type:complete len:398 (+) Transcript_26818:744-1937(+)
MCDALNLQQLLLLLLLLTLLLLLLVPTVWHVEEGRPVARHCGVVPCGRSWLGHLRLRHFRRGGERVLMLRGCSRQGVARLRLRRRHGSLGLRRLLGREGLLAGPQRPAPVAGEPRGQRRLGAALLLPRSLRGLGRGSARGLAEGLALRLPHLLLQGLQAMTPEVLLALHPARVASQELTLRPIALDQAVDQQIVVGDDHNAPAELRQALRQGLASLGVQVVRRLVEEEEVHGSQGQRGQLQPGLLAPAQAADGHPDGEIALEAEVAQHTPRDLGQALVGGRNCCFAAAASRRPPRGLCLHAEPGLQLLAAGVDEVLHRRQLAARLDLVHQLPVVPDLAVRRVVHGAAAGLQLPGAQVQEGRLARAVPAQQHCAASAAEAHVASDLQRRRPAALGSGV